MREIFPKVFGNMATKTRLAAAIENRTLPHAFLICGPFGSGKNTLVLEISAAMNCENRNSKIHSLPCRTCNTCRRIFQGSYVDIKRMPRREDKQTIGVSEIRDFREDMFLSSTESDYKIYIINEADRMTSNAQNALLKVLEEPPSNVLIFLLTASDDGILSTIKSRTQHISMQRFTAEELHAYLKKEGKISEFSDSEKIADLLILADGRIGKALSLIGDSGKEEALKFRELTENIVLSLRQSTPYSTLFSAIKDLPTKKDEFREALESVITAIRDLIVIKNAPKAPLRFYSNRDNAKEISATFNMKRLMKIYDILYDALDDSAKNVNISALTTYIGAKIKLI